MVAYVIHGAPETIIVWDSFVMNRVKNLLDPLLWALAHLGEVGMPLILLSYNQYSKNLLLSKDHSVIKDSSLEKNNLSTIKSTIFHTFFIKYFFFYLSDKS